MSNPDPFTHENNFYLTCQPSRIAKATAHLDLFRRAIKTGGDIAECGVFKGASFSRFAIYRSLFAQAVDHKMLGFDTFDTFPETIFPGDLAKREAFIKEAGNKSISTEALIEVLENKGCAENVDLIAGDICVTVPKYVEENPDLELSLINLDTDIYEPAVVILKHLYPRLKKGGILLLDDYNVFPGETQAVDEYFKGQNVKIECFPFAKTPWFIVKQ